MDRPRDNGNNVVSSSNANWDYSEFVSPDGTTSADPFWCHLLGADNGSAGNIVSAGIVDGFENSRTTVGTGPSSSGVIDTDSWMLNLFDDGTIHDEILDDVLAKNDEPPYDRIDYPGGNNNMPKPLVMGLKALTSQAGDGTGGPLTNSTASVVLPGFAAPCGLLEFEIQSEVGVDVFDVLVELAAGSYKGVAAESMLTMRT